MDITPSQSEPDIDSECLESVPGSPDVSNEQEMAVNGVPFCPPRGSRKVKARTMQELERNVIRRLPNSAKSGLPSYQSMDRDDVRFRIKELFGFDGKSIQVDTIWHVGCRQESMILVAKTGVGKSLIFQAIPLLDPYRPGIALVVVPLKHIQYQQAEKVNMVPGAKAAIYNGDHRDEKLRYSIAAGHFTHG